MTYNSWANFETWAAFLRLSGAPHYPASWRRAKSADNVFAAARELENTLRATIPDTLPDGWARDIVHGAAGNVSWEQIAAALRGEPTPYPQRFFDTLPDAEDHAVATGRPLWDTRRLLERWMVGWATMEQEEDPNNADWEQLAGCTTRGWHWRPP